MECLSQVLTSFFVFDGLFNFLAMFLLMKKVEKKGIFTVKVLGFSLLSSFLVFLLGMGVFKLIRPSIPSLHVVSGAIVALFGLKGILKPEDSLELTKSISEKSLKKVYPIILPFIIGPCWFSAILPLASQGINSSSMVSLLLSWFIFSFVFTSVFLILSKFLKDKFFRVCQTIFSLVATIIGIEILMTGLRAFKAYLS